jgi:hypothetical protein
MTHSRRRVRVRNAVRLSVGAKREPMTTFDPSRFGEIEITPELRARFMALGLARDPEERATPRKRTRLVLTVGLAILWLAMAAALVRTSQSHSRASERPFGHDPRGPR